LFAPNEQEINTLKTTARTTTTKYDHFCDLHKSISTYLWQPYRKISWV